MRKLHSSNVTTSIVSALLVASVTLALGWPSQVNAVGEEEQAAAQQSAQAKAQAAPANTTLRKDESRIDELTVSATLVTSESDPQRRAIRLECQNPTEHPITGQLRVSLTRTEGSARERVMPQPRVVWSQPQTVAVEAGGSVTREIPLPKQFADQVGGTPRPGKTAKLDKRPSFPRVYFDVIAEPIEHAPQRAKVSSLQPKASFSKANRSKLASNYDILMGY